MPSVNGIESPPLPRGKAKEYSALLKDTLTHPEAHLAAYAAQSNNIQAHARYSESLEAAVGQLRRHSWGTREQRRDVKALAASYLKESAKSRDIMAKMSQNGAQHLAKAKELVQGQRREADLRYKTGHLAVTRTAERFGGSGLPDMTQRERAAILNIADPKSGVSPHYVHSVAGRTAEHRIREMEGYKIEPWKARRTLESKYGAVLPGNELAHANHLAREESWTEPIQSHRILRNEHRDKGGIQW